MALFLTDALPLLVPPVAGPGIMQGSVHERLRDHLVRHGASFFGELLDAAGGGLARPVLDALWDLAWAGEVTNDAPEALRGFLAAHQARSQRQARVSAFRSRRHGPPAAVGRWSRVPIPTPPPTPTERMKAFAEQLLARHGVLTRDAVVHEEVTGGFSAIYPVLRALEEAGRIRRGYFVAGRGGLQFALPGALDRLRTRKSADGADAQAVVLPAADPANPYGAALPWPGVKMSGTRLQRAAGSHVVLVEGRLGTYVSRNGRDVFPLLPDEEPLRSHVARGVAQALARWAEASGRPTLGWASGRGAGLAEGPLGRHLAEVGFVRSGPGFRLEGTNGLPAPQGRPGR